MIKDLFAPLSAEVNIIPVQSEGLNPDFDASQLPPELPVLALRNAALFPGCIYPINIGRDKSLALIKAAEKHNLIFIAVPQLDASIDDPERKDLANFGSLARVVKTIVMPDETVTAILQSLSRVELAELVSRRPYLTGRYFLASDKLADSSDAKIKAMADNIKEKATAILKQGPLGSKESVASLRGIEDYNFLVNFIATTIEIENTTDKIALLETDDMWQRGMGLLALLEKQVNFARIKQEINAKVKEEIDQQQREYYLNNQLKTIQEELGMDEGEEIKQFRERAKDKKWSEEMQKTFEKELAKLERYNPNSPDYSIQYNYIDFLLTLPWGEFSEDNLDLKNARKVLDEDHYGLEKIKERIIEYLAVLKLKGNMKSPILCLYGPPGVGKTSLGKSIARALGRKYVRISLGGLHDESEIRGHRKTYIGALPGRILNGIARAGSSNPVIVLDEIDKVGSDYKGDPAAALLEALDPEQNTTFHDNYLDLDYDLSHVLFITTANGTSTIQSALRDRMEMINVTGYLAEEKMEIAKKYLIPKQIEEHGLKKGELKLDKTALATIISDYTHESGVRGLDKQIAKLARVTAKKIALEEERPAVIKKEMLKEYLGLPINFHDKVKGNEGVGVVTGLAWTEMGGEVLFVESSISEGKGELSMTGNLGDVMKESATIGYKYIKAHPELAGMTYEQFSKKDIHVHVPEGATPKDGPSAGITMVSSMVSALSGKALKSGIAMTGEMTLRGKVLPVGGIKEKILAAKRAGVHTIVISEDNRKDIEDIPAIYIQGVDFHYVRNINEVLAFIFE